jgi:isocitrate dehydrogenase kinase/phosphatase
MYVPVIFYIIYRNIKKGIQDKTMQAGELLRLLNLTLPKDEVGKARAKLIRELYYYNKEAWLQYLRCGEKSIFLILLCGAEAIKEHFGIPHNIVFDKHAGIYIQENKEKLKN